MKLKSSVQNQMSLSDKYLFETQLCSQNITDMFIQTDCLYQHKGDGFIYMYK